MKFRIWTILWVFALFASAMAAFGAIRGSFTVPLVLLFWSLIFDQVRERRGLTLLELVVIFALCFVLWSLHNPAITRSYARERVKHCGAELSRLASALMYYVRQNGTLPPAKVTNESSQTTLSWRSLNWIPARVDEYGTFSLYGPTCFFAVLGEGTAWEAISSDDKVFSDDPSKTILLIEQRGRDVPWSHPTDLTFEEALAFLTSPIVSDTYYHTCWGKPGFFQKPYPDQDVCGIHGAFADGSVRLVPLPIDEKLARALLTANGGEEIPDAQMQQFWKLEMDYPKIYALSLFVVIALLPTMKVWRDYSTGKGTSD